jgi:hypothetical protein
VRDYSVYLSARSFGDFRPSYSYYDPNSFSFMRQQGYLGLTYPHPDRLPEASVRMLSRPLLRIPRTAGGDRRIVVVKKEIPWSSHSCRCDRPHYFLFNASFYWWKAGLTFGPRYAGASIPLLCVGLALAWSQASVGWRRALIVLACCSIFL